MNLGSRRQEGTLYGALAYLIWGIFPLYFNALKPSGPWEVLAHRIVWTLVLCGTILLLTRNLRWLAVLSRHPRRLARRRGGRAGPFRRTRRLARRRPRQPRVARGHDPPPR